MRVAALYDIHGNRAALEAVLGEVEAAGVDLVVVGGDVVPGPFPVECLDRLLELEGPVRFLHGNGEADLLRLHRGDGPLRFPERVRPALEWVREQFGARHFEALASWPSTVRLEVPGLGDVLFCHATPRSDVEIFTRRTPEEVLRPVFEPTGADLVVCGHTHMPADRRVGPVRVVTSGSVGLPFGRPGAFWLLLGPDGVEPRRTEYDREAAAAGVAASAYPLAGDVRLVDPPSEESILDLFRPVSMESAPGA